MTAIDIEHLLTWVGKQETREDDITLFPAQALAAALDDPEVPQKGDSLPPFWEWMYFLPTPSASATGRDGHPDKGGFLPPVPLPRRMWAAGEVECHEPLIIGSPAKRISTIDSVDLKEGSTGTLVFVNVRHEIEQNDRLCIRQVQNIVYREQPSERAALPTGKPAPQDAQFARSVQANPVLLFRYSALTYNGHRIHYDRDYAVNEELYPALVVHGPLLVTLLLDLKRRKLPQAQLKSYTFRAVRPTFDNQTFSLAGKQDGTALSLWSADEDGYLGMSIQATLASEE